MTGWIEGDSPEQVVKHTLERDVQSACIRFARRKGAYCRKFSSPGNRSVPDYVIVYQGDVWFVEFKRPRGVCTQKQIDEQKAILEAGGEVWVVDSLYSFEEQWRNAVPC